jgi:phenylacetate-CoA ligase
MLQGLIRALPLSITDCFHTFLLNDYQRTLSFVTRANPELFHTIGAKKVLQIFQHAAATVPAYRSFLQKHNVDPLQIKTIEDFERLVPITDKTNYIKKYDIAERCVSGKLPLHGNIDESGGTSGKPANWIRSVHENQLLFHVAKFEFEYIYNVSTKNMIVLSSWSTGPWATGIKFCQLMQHFTLVKCTSTNIKNIVETLEMFGKDYEYIIAGYPPFLKKFIDECRLPLKQYKIHLLTGGEGISLDWVSYFKRQLWDDALIISSYGASDIDIGVGFETPFSQNLRQLCLKNKELRSALFGEMPTIPMLFQYNPLMHHITQTYNRHEGKYEFVITLLDPAVASPKIKYNLHDEGNVYSYQEMIALVTRYAPECIQQYMKHYHHWPILRLPFLSVAGRTDGTISLDGANIYPEQVEAGIISQKQLEKKTQAFMIYKNAVKGNNQRFTIAIQLKSGVTQGKLLQRQYHDAILKKVLSLNPDFAESYRWNKQLCDPVIVFHKFDSPLFCSDDEQVKMKYIKT